MAFITKEQREAAKANAKAVSALRPEAMAELKASLTGCEAPTVIELQKLMGLKSALLTQVGFTMMQTAMQGSIPKESTLKTALNLIRTAAEIESKAAGIAQRQQEFEAGQLRRGAPVVVAATATGKPKEIKGSETGGPSIKPIAAAEAAAKLTPEELALGIAIGAIEGPEEAEAEAEDNANANTNAIANAADNANASTTEKQAA